MVTMSAGLSNDRVESLEDKMRDADLAMYKAKEQPGNSVHLA
ncbi:MAG: hypothetical protein ACREUZ_09890 [Burkholderiales bacterium]